MMPPERRTTTAVNLKEFYVNVSQTRYMTANDVTEDRHQELLKKRRELEDNRPQDIEGMRRWKHTMGKILQELESYKR